MNNIPLIASIICALTAITTSFRALGRSREDDFPTHTTAARSKGLLLHLFVTFVWFGLSIIFAVPFIQERLAGSNNSLLPLAAPFTLIVIICCLIWRKALSPRD